MKLLFSILAFALTAQAQAAPQIYVCRVQSVTSEAVPGLQFSTNVRIQGVDCSPQDLAHLSKISFTAPAAAKEAAETALRDGTAIALTTAQPVGYGGTLIGINGSDVGALAPIEYAQFDVFATAKRPSAVGNEAKRVLDAHSVPRVARVDHIHGKELKTWSRTLAVKIAADLEISFFEEGPSLSYGSIHPPSSSIRVEYLKSAAGNLGRVLTAAESAQVLSLLKASLPYKVEGTRLSSDKPAAARFTKTADGLVQVSLREIL